RDFHVTGVQTCALPIYRDIHAIGQALHGTDRAANVEHRIRALETRRIECASEDDDLVLDAGEHGGGFDHGVGAVGDQHMPMWLRSEERRVGKEWRERWV